MTKGYPDWMRAFLLLGKHDTSFLPVLLAADGSLYAILQGDYLGSPMPIKLDEDGQLYMYITDVPDQYGQKSNIGIGELAARLGSPLSYDRRGQILFTERFDHGRGMWEEDYGGAGAGTSLSPDYYTSGGYSLKLVAGADAGGFAWVGYTRSLFPGLRVGLGLHFSVVSAPSVIQFTLGHWDGTNYLKAALRYIVSTTTIQLQTTGAAWTTLTSAAAIIAEPDLFNYCKLVADFDTGLYDRVLLNEATYDASAIPIYSAESDLAPSVQIDIEVTSGLHATDGIYVDDIALTTQEP